MLVLARLMVRTMKSIFRLGKNPEPPQASYVGQPRAVSVEEVHEMIGRILVDMEYINGRRWNE